MLASEQLNQIISKLQNDNYQIDILLNIASMFERLTDKDVIDELVAQFHNHAGHYPFIDDVDFGAMILEITATNVSDLNLKKRLINEAIYRARWCAQAATSGGEGLCRKRHISKLENYLTQLCG